MYFSYKNVSFYPEETEVLFKSGTMFVVESIRKGDHPLPIRSKKGDEIIEIILKEK